VTHVYKYLRHISPVHKADSLTAETAALHLGRVRENGSETGPLPEQLTTGEDPLCTITQNWSSLSNCTTTNRFTALFPGPPG